MPISRAQMITAFLCTLMITGCGLPKEATLQEMAAEVKALRQDIERALGENPPPEQMRVLLQKVDERLLREEAALQR